jgi:hypothetical protein
MPVSLTASNSLLIQAAAAQMWTDKTAAGLQYDNPVTTVSKLANSQTMRAAPVFDDAGTCVSYKIFWPDLTDAAAAAVYSGAVVNPAAACDLITGNPIGTKSKTYAPNVFIDDVFEVSDNLCGNDAQFVDLVATQTNFSMQKIRNAINRRAIQFLETNKSPNVDVAATAGMTIAGTLTTVPAVQFQDPSILMKFQIMAESNRLGGDFLIMDGTNLLLNKELAPYLGLNDQQRSFGSLFADISARYNADLRDLQTVVGANATYLVNPNMFGLFNQTGYGLSPVEIDRVKGTMAYKVADPVLTYRKTMQSNGRVVTATVPIEYDVLYQKVCTGVDALGRPVFKHTFKMSFLGGIVLGTESNTGHTGILKFVSA